MPVGLYTGPNVSIANGVATVFAYDFQIFDADHLVATVDGLVVTNYTVDGVGDAGGGSIIFSAPPANGAEVLRERAVPYERETDYQNNGDFREDTVDRDFDQVVMQIQQLEAITRRGPLLPSGGLTGLVFPEPGAGEHIRWNVAGTALETVPIDDVGDTFLQSGVGAVARSWTSKVGEAVSVKDFNAKGDDTDAAGDASKIQAALDFLKAATSHLNAGPDAVVGRLFLPKGIYRLSVPLKMYPKIEFFGEGSGSALKEGAGFVGSDLVLADTTGVGNPTQWTGGILRDMAFTATGATIGAFSANGIANILNSRFKNLYLYTRYGLDLATYTQACKIQNIVDWGTVEQLLHLKGNFNLIEHIQKEGGSGSVAEAYIYIQEHATGDSAMNLLRGILTQQTGNANKISIRLEGTDTTIIEGFWDETTAIQYTLDIIDSVNVKLIGRHSYTSARKVNLTNSVLFVDYLNTDGEDIAWHDVFNLSDTKSKVHIGSIYSRRGADSVPLSLDQAFKVDRFINRTARADQDTTFVGYEIQQYPRRSVVGNILVNPSFEGGIFGWTPAGAAGSTDTFVASEVGSGLMLNGALSGSGNRQWTQDITIAAGQVGRALTLGFLGKLTSAGILVPLISGCGITASSAINRINFGEGWQLVFQTVYPQSAGALTFGPQCVSGTAASVVNVDSCFAHWGTDAQPVDQQFQQIEIGGKSVIFASAAPTTGTWKQGDITFNTGVAAGGSPGWSCTTAGTPGTWKAWANVAA